MDFSIIDASFGNWANIANCKVNFYGLGARGVGVNSIKVINDNSISAYAVAEIPSNNNPGFRIRINMNLFNTLTNSQKIYILTHEIGHCLGLRHTNWLSDGEGSFGTTLIPGTPQTDHFSIMNSGNYHSSVPSFTSMANYDKIAVETLYPFNQYDQWITFPAGRYPNVELYVYDFTEPIEIKWNKDLVQTSSVKLELYQNNQFVHLIGNNVPNTGTYSYPFMLYATPSAPYVFDTYIKITSNSNPSIFDYSPLFRSWYD